MDEGAALKGFRRLCLADKQAGTVRSLATYQKLFAGFEESIASEYARLLPEGSIEVEPPAEDAAAPESDAPKQLGPYNLVRELGRGGQGQVFLAEDTRLSRKVALKILGPSFDPTFVARFRREAAAASRLDHPGICAVYEAGEVDGTQFIAMRYVDGESLAERIARAKDASPVEPSSTQSSGPSTRGEIGATLHLIERPNRGSLVHQRLCPTYRFPLFRRY